MMYIRNILMYIALACVIKKSIQTCELTDSVLQCEDIKTFTELTPFPKDGYEVVSIRNSNFTNLKANAFEGPHVYKIKIMSTSLRTIEPSGFDNFSDLIVLNVSHNNISTITRGIFNNLLQLTTLDLSNNSIQFIEDNSFCGSQIVNLNLHRNKIDTLPFLRNCTKLQMLRISDNHISSLQNNHLPRSLKYLYLGNNRIENIEIEAFANMTELIELDLSNNKLYKVSDGCIPLGLLQPLVALRYLNVSHNSLSRILLGTFSHLHALGTLDLGFNNLTHLPSGLLRQLPLTFFSIRNNMFKTLENNHFDGRYAVTVSLDNNPWICNDLSHKIHQILTITRYNKINNGTHYSSPNIMGIKCNSTESNITIDQSTYAKSILKIIASNNEDLQADLEGTNNLLFDIKGLLSNITLLKAKDLQQFQKTANETGDQFSNLTQVAPFDFKEMLNNLRIAIEENREQLRRISRSDEGLGENPKTISSTIQQFQENVTSNKAISADQTNSELSSIRVLLLSLLLSNFALIGLTLAAFAFKAYTSKRNANVSFMQDTLLNTYT